MFTEDKVTEIFCMADDFCRFFDAMMEKYTLRHPKPANFANFETIIADFKSRRQIIDYFKTPIAYLETPPRPFPPPPPVSR